MKIIVKQLSILNLFFESLSKIQKGTYLPIYCFYIEDLEILLGLIGEKKILGNVQNLFQGANLLPDAKISKINSWDAYSTYMLLSLYL